MKDNMLQEKNNQLSLVHGLFIAAALTSSFDIFLVLNLGLNFRIAQVLLLLPILSAIAMALNLERKFTAPLGIKPLILWTTFIFVFIPNGSFPERSIGYFSWMVINIATIFACVQLFSTSEKIFSLMRWYIYTFVAIALYGLLQFVSPLLGLGAFLLVEQWWIPGVLARINGFSYEPSFFATYLLLGWVVCAYLMGVNNSFMSKARLKWSFIIITLSLFLSSSRMGILMMVLWYMQYPFRFALNLFRGRLNRQQGKIVFIMVVILTTLVVGVLFVIGLDKVSFLFSGIGLMGEASHSVNDRENGLVDTLSLFIDSPFIGTSLGGVAPGIARLHGVPHPDFETVKLYEGNAVFAEVLAASGIFGFIPFVIYIFTIIVKPLMLAKRLPPERSQLLVGLVLALIFEFVILQFNQNILRQYLWMHISILAAVYAVFRRDANVAVACNHQRVIEA